MAQLTIDISPMAINRTAMYFVVRDSVRHLLGRFPLANLTACGIRIDRGDFMASGFRLDPGVEATAREALGRVLDDRQPWTDPLRSDERPGLTIVFDPLYLALVEWTSEVVVYALDLTPLTYPQWHDPRVSRLYVRAFDLLARSGVHPVAISESTRRDLWANLGIRPSRIAIVPLYDRFARDRGATRPRTALPTVKKLLFVGSLEERKNVRGLIRAFEASRLVEQGFVLHIVGGDGTGSAETKRLAAQTRGVFVLGALSDDDLEVEYASCTALVYPSFWEGFGLPALEALSRDLPCVLSRTGALPEIGGSLVTYVDPCSVESIRDGMLSVVGLPRLDAEERESRRQAQLARFTLPRYTAALDAIVDRALLRVRSSPVSGTAALGESDGGMRTVTAMSRRERWKRVAIETLLRLRVVEATTGPVPHDSLSPDYLYGIQQENRLVLARAITALRTCSLAAYPRAIASIALRYVALRLTNAYVTSQINEITLLRLEERKVSTDR